MKVLTAPGGEIAVSHELRNMIALLDDGRLLIADADKFNLHVRGFMARLKQGGREFIPHYVEYTEIKNVYENIETAEERSDMQNAATTLFDKAVKMRASDIHIRISVRESTKIYFRMHGNLRFIESKPFKYGDQLCTTIFHTLTDVSDSTFESMSRQDARISDKSKIPSNIDGIRIATSPQVGGYIMVLRLLYNDTSDDLDLRSQGYSTDQAERVEYMKKRPTGAMIIAGPTGSGKSTSLQRILRSIIERTGGRKHIITVEDPPEYPIPGAVQTPVTNTETEEERSREYQASIKAAMRLDPDIIMLSEVRDRPTASLVIQAAMTGHQVWTTVHANSALAIIDRLCDLGVSLEIMADPTVVGGLICQRLLPTLCPHCKVPLSEHIHEYDEVDVRRFMSVLNFEGVYCASKSGCEHCSGAGTKGRTAIAETVVTDNNLMSLLRNRDRLAAIDYVRREQGVMTMLEHAISKVNDGLVDPFHAEDIVGALNASSIERDNRT